MKNAIAVLVIFLAFPLFAIDAVEEKRQIDAIAEMSRQDDIDIAKKDEAHRVAHRAERGMWLPCMYDFKGGTMFVYFFVAFIVFPCVAFAFMANDATKVIGIAMMILWLIFAYNRYDELWVVAIAIPIGAFWGGIRAIAKNY